MALREDGAGCETVTLHASCVAFEDRAVLLQGASGRGKSALALRMLALGCTLVADDRTEIRRVGPRLLARAPKPIRGLIEARGVGLLRARVRDDVALALAVDLGQPECERLPEARTVDILGQTLTSLRYVDADYFPAALLQMLKGGRATPI